MKKIIMVGEYGIQFEQRARGEETPYWLGTIYQETPDLGMVKVGHFQNSGCGGPTDISPAIAIAFRKMVDDTGTVFDFDYRERADIVITYAELMGYDRKAKALNPPYTLAELVRTYARDFKKQA
jgi:hypothetical protein